MDQLVGQSCVICRARIGSILDARFCPECRSPVHTNCTRTGAAIESEGGCIACGAPASAELDKRRDTEVQFEAWKSGAGQRHRAGCLLIASIGFILFGILQFAITFMRPMAADRNVQLGSVVNALVPVGFGFVGFLIAIRSMPRKK